MKTSSVGQVREVHDPVDRRELGRFPDRRPEEAERQVRPRPVEVDRVEPAIGQRCGAAVEVAHPGLPGSHGIGLVEAADVRDRAPEAVVRLGGLVVREDELGPVRCRRGSGAPVRRMQVHNVADLGKEGQEVGAGAVGGHVVERVRRLWPGERDPGRALVREVPQPVDHPGRDVRERLGVAAAAGARA